MDPLAASQAPTDDGDYHLLVTSDCIDVGTANDAAATDIDGGDRPWGAGYDLGSDEYGAVGTRIFANGFESGDTTMWSTVFP